MVDTIRVVKAPDKYTPNETDSYLGTTQTIFLAGSIEMGKAKDWQTDFIEQIEEKISQISCNELVIYNPRREDWDSSWVQDPTKGTQFRHQVEWELRNLEKSSIVIFNFEPKTQSPITLMELGYIMGSKLHTPNQKVFVCCPEDFYRYGNVKVICNRLNVDVHHTKSELMFELFEHLIKD
jgi:hypothetical protein